MSSKTSGYSDEFHSAHSLFNMFTTFDQCNQLLYDKDEINIIQYMNVTKHVPYDYETPHGLKCGIVKLPWINQVLEYLLHAASFNPHAYRIPVSSLDSIGFNMESYRSKMPRWIQLITNRSDNSTRRECRFLKKHKMVKYVDYDDNVQYIGDDAVCIGYCVSINALYKLIANKYGQSVFEALLIRTHQIMYYFNQYKINYKDKYIAALQRTVTDLTYDIKALVESPTRKEDLDRNSFFGDDGSYRHSGSLTPIQSDIILDDKGYADEISAIHKTLETTIHRVDDRISDIHIQLTDIATRIDDIIGSIVMTDDRRSYTSMYDSEPLSEEDCDEFLCDSKNSNAMVDHVDSIFQEYDAISRSTSEVYMRLLDSNKQTLRNTCIGNEHSL